MQASARKHQPVDPDIVVALATPVRAAAGTMLALVSLVLASGMLSGFAVIWRALS